MDEEMRKLCEKYAQLSVVANINDFLRVRDEYNAMKSTYSKEDQDKIEAYYKACEAKLRRPLPKEAYIYSPIVIWRIDKDGTFHSYI